MFAAETQLSLEYKEIVMKRWVITVAWIAGAFVIANTAMQSLYGATTAARKGITVPTNWSQVSPPPTTPNFRTPYVPH